MSISGAVKKFISILMSALILFAAAVPAFADDGTAALSASFNRFTGMVEQAMVLIADFF